MHNKFYLSFLIVSAILLLIVSEISLTSFAALADNKPMSPDSLNNKSEENWFIDPYFTQSFHLKWIEEEGIGDFQGLLVPELGIIIKGDSHSDISICFDISLVAQIYDIYNIQFAPISFNINQAYLNYNTDFSNKYLPESFKLEFYSGNDNAAYDEIYNVGLEAAWISEQNVKLYTEFLFYDLFSEASYNFLNNNYGLTIGAQWSDIFDKGEDKSTDFTIEYEGLKNKINLQLNQRINDSLSLEVAYAHNCQISTSINYKINNNWQLEITGLFSSIKNYYNEPGQNNREFSLLTSLSYRL